MRLAELQAAFVASLRAPADVALADGLLQAIQPGPVGVAERLAIYRRTSRHSQRSALAAAYPVIHALLGEDLFQALMADHLQSPGSRHGNLHCLGADFVQTIAREPACTDFPYLQDVARLEWALHDSFFAADRASETLVDPANLGAADQSRVGLVLHPSARLLACSTPARAIWLAHQPEAQQLIEDLDLTAAPEWLAVHRRPEGHCITVLTGPEYQLLRRAAAGGTLAASLAEAEAEAEAEARAKVRVEAESAGGMPDLSACLMRWLPAQLLQGFALR